MDVTKYIKKTICLNRSTSRCVELPTNGMFRPEI